MKKMRPAELERQIKTMESCLEEIKAAAVHSEEDFATLCVLVDVMHEVKRELIKKRPSMKRIRMLTSCLRLKPPVGEADDDGPGSAQ